MKSRPCNANNPLLLLVLAGGCTGKSNVTETLLILCAQVYRDCDDLNIYSKPATPMPSK